MADMKISELTEKTTLDWWEELVYAQNLWNGRLKVSSIKEYSKELPSQTWNNGKILQTNWTAPSRVAPEYKQSDFNFKSATSWATLTISDYNTIFVPTWNFTVSCWTLKEWMQYVLRVNTWGTAYVMTLWTWITNPYDEELTLTATKKTTVVFLATSSSTLELFAIRTEE